jgi:beta-galactosidase/beta-glucuronidase
MRTVDLNGVWLLKELSTGKDDTQGAFEDHKRDADWGEALVPGVIHLDLIRSEGTPHPYYRLNELDVKWIEGKGWCYRKEFVTDEDLLKLDSLQLIFEGLDTFATVWVNGQKVGSFSNMFHEHRIDVKGLLKKGAVLLRLGLGAQASDLRHMETRVAEGVQHLQDRLVPLQVRDR